MRKRLTIRSGTVVALCLVFLLVVVGVAYAATQQDNPVYFNLTCQENWWEVGKLDIYNPTGSTHSGYVEWEDDLGTFTSNFSVGAGATVRRGAASKENLIKGTVFATTTTSDVLEVSFVENRCDPP